MGTLSDLKLTMLDSDLSGPLLEAVRSMNVNSERPLGKFHPWAWWLELVLGCNLTCWHCPTRLLPRGEFKFMQKEQWINLLEITRELTPYNRYAIANAGEPTLHPELLDFLSLAREKSPHTEIQLITNGTTLTDETYKYKDFFDAGAHSVYVDMYAPKELHIELAKRSGFMFYELDATPKGAPKVWAYHNDPALKFIVLVKNPNNWSKKRTSAGRLHTCINQLDWSVAEKHGLHPVTEAPERRCDLPSKFVSLHYDGKYCFCCNDFLTANKEPLGDVSSGPEGFLKFWLGEYMQATRKQLHNKDRKSHEFCSKCSFTSIRCDIDWWNPNILDYYWEGTKWERSRI